MPNNVARATRRKQTVTITGGQPLLVHFHDTMPNYIVVFNNSSVFVYAETYGTASPTNWDVAVPPYGTKMIALEVGTSRVSLYAEEDATVTVMSFEAPFTPTAIAQTIEIISAGQTAIGENVNIASFTAPLPSGSNKIGKVDIASALPAGNNTIGQVVVLGFDGATNKRIAIDTTGAVKTVLTNEGTDASGVTPLAGASGIRGWLSSIFARLSSTLTTHVIDTPAPQAMTQSPVTAQITVGDSPTPLRVGGTDLPNRKQLVVSNLDTSNTIYIGGSNVSLTNGFPLRPGQTITFDQKPGTSATVYAIAPSGTTVTVAVMEVA